MHFAAVSSLLDRPAANDGELASGDALGYALDLDLMARLTED